MDRSADLRSLHAQARQDRPGAKEALFGALTEELRGPIQRLLQEPPYQTYLAAEGLLTAACRAYAGRDRPPTDLELWLSGLAQEHLLTVLCRLDLRVDLEAAAVFYQRLRPLLVALIRQKLRRAPCGDLDASDLVQTVCLRVVKQVETKGAPPEHLKPWLTAVIENRLIDCARRRRRRPTVSLTATGEAAAVARERPALEELVRKEALQRLAAEMDGETRQLYALRVEDKMPWEQVARLVGRTVSDVRVRYHRGLARARRRAAGEGGAG
jgi:RNA polymerase sigma-70 factor (ECF subfamily)